MNDQTISGIIATHNRPELLRRALRSMIDQEQTTLDEIIVIFDGAEPDPSLMAEFPEIPMRVVENHRSRGLAGARNTGIEIATSEWLAFCDDDDEWKPGKVRAQIAGTRSGTEFVVGGIEVRSGDKSVHRVPGKDALTLDDFLRSRVMAAHPSTYFVLRDAIINGFGYVDEDIPGSYAEDYDWLIRAARRRPITVVNRPVSIVHWHPGSFFTNRYRMIYSALEYLLDKTPEFDRTRVGRARIHGQQAFALAAMGERRRALKMAGRTFLLDPRQLRSYLTVAVSSGFISAERLQALANATGRGI